MRYQWGYGVGHRYSHDSRVDDLAIDPVPTENPHTATSSTISFPPTYSSHHSPEAGGATSQPMALPTVTPAIPQARQAFQDRHSLHATAGGENDINQVDDLIEDMALGEDDMVFREGDSDLDDQGSEGDELSENELSD